MKVAVFGGTGYVSRYLVDGLITAGHEVRLLSRRATTVRDKVESFVGDALSTDDVRRVMETCQVVVNCIGRLKNKGEFYAAITSNVLENMTKVGITRYILITNSTVRVPDDSPTFFSWAGSLVFKLLFPRMVEDKQREFEMVARSSTEWVIFRLPMVVESREARGGRMDVRALRGLLVSNGTVAQAIVQEIEKSGHRGTAQFLFD